MLPFTSSIDIPYRAKKLILVPSRELGSRSCNKSPHMPVYASLSHGRIWWHEHQHNSKCPFVLGAWISSSHAWPIVWSGPAKAIKLRDTSSRSSDEVDDAWPCFKFQLTQYLSNWMPQQRQNIMFSATMTEVEENDRYVFYCNRSKSPLRSGSSPGKILNNTSVMPQFLFQSQFVADIFLQDSKEYNKVPIFVTGKKNASNYSMRH